MWAAGQWRALLAAGLSALAMMIASGLIFGWDLRLRWFPLILENLGHEWIEYGRFCSVPEFRPYATDSWAQPVLEYLAGCPLAATKRPGAALFPTDILMDHAWHLAYGKAPLPPVHSG